MTSHQPVRRMAAQRRRFPIRALQVGGTVGEVNRLARLFYTMKLVHKTVLGLALLLVFQGCSSLSTTGLTDLGSVDVGGRETRHYVLPGGRNCQVTFTPLVNDQVLVEAVVLASDHAGNMRVLARPRAQTRFGQKVTLNFGDGSVVVTPKRT